MAWGAAGPGQAGSLNPNLVSWAPSDHLLPAIWALCMGWLGLLSVPTAPFCSTPNVRACPPGWIWESLSGVSQSQFRGPQTSSMWLFPLQHIAPEASRGPSPSPEWGSPRGGGAPLGRPPGLDEDSVSLPTVPWLADRGLVYREGGREICWLCVQKEGSRSPCICSSVHRSPLPPACAHRWGGSSRPGSGHISSLWEGELWGCSRGDTLIGTHGVFQGRFPGRDAVQTPLPLDK